MLVDKVKWKITAMSENLNLERQIGGYEYSIVNVPPEMQNLELY